MDDTILEATVSSKGQVTLPVALRQKLGIGPGTKLRFELGPLNTTIVVRPDLPMSTYRGILKPFNLDPKDLEIEKEYDKSADPSRWP
jgi:AbrB family looped-hinge helix DNA binding protein